MTPHEFYLQQSYITDPKEYSVLFDAIQNDVESICKAAQNVIVHYFGNPKYKPPKNRWVEADTRSVSKILDIVLRMDSRPLCEERVFENRFVGCCRDFSVLTVSIMRHKGIPARVRYGTANYFEKGYYWDHVIVEYWNGLSWVRVDPQLSHQDRDWGINIRDLPIDTFFPGARGWQLVRSGQEQATKFGLGSQRGGIEFVLVEMLLDLAALNREELLCWEGWGYSSMDYKDFSEEDKLFLDRVAATILTLDNQSFQEWLELFKHPRLLVPSEIISFSPAAHDSSVYPIKVHLERV